MSNRSEDALAKSRPTALQFNLRTLIVTFTLAALLIGLLAFVIRDGNARLRSAKLRSLLPVKFSTLSHGLQLRGGTHELALKAKAWPPECPTNEAGDLMNSWRLHVADELGNIMPDDGQSPRVSPSEPWNSSANQLASLVCGPVFCLLPPYETTIVFGVTGPGTAFDKKLVTKYAELPPHIIVAMEVADSKTHWMQPGDYDVTQLLAAKGSLGSAVKGVLPDRVHVIFADGEVWALSSDMPMSSLYPFLTLDNAAKASRNKVLGPYRLLTE